MDANSEKHLFFLTGELSGDMHAAELVNEIRRARPNWRFTAIGSDHLRSAGAEIWYDCLKMGAMGLYEAFLRAWPILRMRGRFIRELSTIDPDLLVAVDYRAANINLLHAAHRQGYRGAYYIAPVMWGKPGSASKRRTLMKAVSVAERSGKVKAQTRDRFSAVADVCDVVILIYPICEDEYREAGANVHYVGHPLVNIIEKKLELQSADFQRAEELAELTSDGGKLIGVLPGSRIHEFRHHCSIIRKVVGIVRDAFPKSTFFLPLASPRLMPQLEHYWPGVRNDCRLISSDDYDWYSAAHLLLAKSGTAVQTGMILGTPMVAYYRIISDLLYKISKALFLDRDLWTFPNVLAGRQVIPEFIQSDFTVENVAGAAIELLRDKEVALKQKEELKKLRDILYRPDCLELSAQLIINAAEKAKEG